MGERDASIGSLLIASWVNCMCYLLVLTQAYTFHKRFPNERWIVKGLVIYMLLVDTASMVSQCSLVYLYAVTHWGDGPFMLTQPVQFPFYVMTTAVATIALHIFLILRYFRLSKNYFVSLVLFLLAAATITSACLLTRTVDIYPAFADRGKLQIYVILWTSLSTAADTAIALALIRELRNINTSFSKTKSLISRLVTATISTGAATSILAVINLITFLLDPTTNITVGFGDLEARACTLTVLFNLNMRSNGRVDYDSNGREHSDHQHVTGAGSRGDIGMMSVNVHKTAVVRIDEGMGYSPRTQQHDAESRSDTIIDDKMHGPDGTGIGF